MENNVLYIAESKNISIFVDGTDMRRLVTPELLIFTLKYILWYLVI